MDIPNVSLTISHLFAIFLIAISILVAIAWFALKHFLNRVIKNTENAISKEELQKELQPFVTRETMENLHLKHKIEIDEEFKKTRHDINNSMNGMSQNLQLQMKEISVTMSQMAVTVARMDGRLAASVTDRIDHSAYRAAQAHEIHQG